jgi:hypothetical protein
MQLRRTKPPNSHKRLQKVDRHEGKGLGVHFLFEDLFGQIAKQNEEIDEDDGK